MKMSGEMHECTACFSLWTDAEMFVDAIAVF